LVLTLVGKEGVFSEEKKLYYGIHRIAMEHAGFREIREKAVAIISNLSS
jgi:hypothetical protein